MPVPTTAPVAVNPLTTAARRNLYFDSLNETLLMRPGVYLMRALTWFKRHQRGLMSPAG